MARRKNYRPAIVLVALALTAVAFATLTFTNVTYWLINATLPPAMKYAGADTGITGRSDGSGYNNYIYVSYYYDPTTGYNITRISIVGFTGDITNYTNVLQLCNRYYNGPLTVTLKAIKSLGYQYESYIRQFRVYLSTDATKYVEFRGSTATATQVTIGTISQGQCLTLGAAVLVDPNLPATVRDGKTIIAGYEIDILFNS